MKKLIVFFSIWLAAVTASAQIEQSTDSEKRTPTENYKEFGGFLLDMGLMSVQTPQLYTPVFDIGKSTTDFNKLFSLNPKVTVTQGLYTVFTPYGSGFGTTDQLQMGSFKLKNGMQLNTYGQYNAEGYRMPSHSALPWEKNAFKGAFELKSGNGAFGIRIEVQQGGGGGYYPY